MDRSREEGRLERDVHLDVDVRGRERRDADDRCSRGTLCTASPSSTG